MRTDAMTVLQGYQPGLQAHDQPANRQFMTQVFGWMAGGLALTGYVSYYLASVAPAAAQAIAGTPLFWLLAAIELALVFVLAGWAHQMSYAEAAACFLAYAALNGVTMSILFLIYTTSSIASTFFVTAGTFAVMALYGWTTKADLTTMGSLCFMGLIGVILASIANFFMRSESLMWATTYVSVLVFVGLTAYDTQKLKQLDLLAAPGSDEEADEAILGALTLYLDFINLFLDILRIMGRKKD
jgi:uncharacterized protein